MKKILILVIVLVAVGGGLYFYKNSAVMDGGYTSAPKETLNPGTVDTTKPVVDNASSGGTNSVSVEKIFTMDEISKHNSRASCYTVVRGNVYDLTNFKDSHPGGEKAILSICGKDGSSAFEDQHGGQNKPENQLVKLKIGVLSK
jgi:cytochrome b involved in lipid metabolism